MLPIRKLTPSRVGLSTYYSKLFITRSEKKINDYGKWLLSQVQLVIEAEGSVRDVAYGNVFNPGIRVPRNFSIMASKYKSFTVTTADTKYSLVWDYAKLVESHGAKVVTRYLKGGDIPCGTDSKGNLLLMSDSGIIYYPNDNKVVGNLEELIGLDNQKAPIEAAELNVMGKNLPLGFVLCYYYGINGLLRRLKTNYRTVARGGRLDLDVDEYVIRFADQSIILSRQDKQANLIFGSLNSFHRTLASFNLDDFNRKDVYGAVLDREGFGVRYVRELELMQSMYIDHISRELLQAMNEPTEFGPLLIRAAELLTTDDHPEEIDGKYRRIRGYERLSGHVYNEMVRGIRMWKSRPLTAKAQVEINPNAVWMAIQQDPSVTIIDEINPIHNLKEKENVTFGGTGGRSARTMVRRTRAYHKNDLGIISEATVDSSDVAVTTYLSANPKLATLRGVGQPGDVDVMDTASILSTSALVSPCSTQDDPKRTNFINIQQSHVIATKGYKPSPLRTGYEQVIAHRVDPLYAVSAKAKGKIAELTNDYVTIIYDDVALPEDRVQIGRIYGVSTGTTIPHDVVCDLKVGQKINSGDIVVYNRGFFERDILNPTQVVWKSGVMVRTAIVDSSDTLEDSSAISTHISEQLEIDKTELRPITLKFDQAIRNLVNLGDTVTADSILCNIEDSVTAESDLFNDESLDALRLLARNSPRAKFDGIVGHIEVVYNGELEDMTESLRELVMQYDRRRAKKARQLRQDATVGRVIDLDVGTIVIKVYIDSKLGASDGDKAVFGNQLKTVIRRVMVGTNTSADGLPIDAIFGYASISDRIVLSPELMGTTNALLKLVSKRAAAAYRKK